MLNQYGKANKNYNIISDYPDRRPFYEPDSPRSLNVGY